jgi:glycerol-3-phosphate dehydrogenase
MLAADPGLVQRAHLLQRLEQTPVWDVIVIGGGATGLGIAVDAAIRGYQTLLLEAADFAKGTSSRSTKLVHGGVRYLAQGNIPLVYSALQERGRLLKNAPHLVRKQAFVIPCYNWSDIIKYVTGLKLYDALAGRLSFGRSRQLSKSEVLTHLPGIKKAGLKGGVLYYDGQFDDARLAINLAQTAANAGATLLNYLKVTDLIKEEEKVSGVVAQDVETGKEYHLQTAVVLNATGVFADAVHRMDVPGSKPLLKQSQGVHLVFEPSILPAISALMIPKTPDGRVLFAIPWHGQVVVGTTDTPVATSAAEPEASQAEIHFILDTLNQYTDSQISENDIRSVFVGLRPLVLPQKEVVSTKELSRDHKIVISNSGLISILGGKWTTYRKMAEDAVNTAIKAGRLPATKSNTKDFLIYGHVSTPAINNVTTNHLDVYGSAAMGILKSWDEQPGTKKLLHPQFPYTEAEVLWAVQHEWARTVEDVLARRLRLLFLNAHAAVLVAPRVAQLLREALNQDAAWEKTQVVQFTQLAKQYMVAAADTTASGKPILTNTN